MSDALIVYFLICLLFGLSFVSVGRIRRDAVGAASQKRRLQLDALLRASSLPKAFKFPSSQRIISSYAPAALLLLILLAAFVLRVMHIWEGIPYLFNWDEPQTASKALNIIKSGDPNPHFFNYGSLIIYASVLTDYIYYFLAHDLGLSSSSISDLNSISDVVTNADTNWAWTISHPQFYVADRFMIVLFGVATVAVTYLIGVRLFPVGFALGAAALLATSPFHVWHSHVAEPNAPVAFFVLTVTWALLVFMDKKVTWALVVAAISVGLACATKYNSGLIYLPLVLAVGVEGLKIRRSDPKRLIRWAIIACVVPALAFLVAMPYALLDYKSFRAALLGEFHHYSRDGHSGFTVEAGIPHLKVILSHLVSTNGILVCVLAVIGLATIRSVKTAIAFCYPILFIIFMSTMKVEFVRNYVQIYPYIALLAMSGVYFIWQVLVTHVAANRKYQIGGTFAAAMVVYIVYGNLEKAVPDAIHNWNAKETRTLAIEQVEKLGNPSDTIIAKELRVHEQDLAKLDGQYSVVPLSAMLGMVCSAQENQHNFVLPTQLSPTPSDESETELAARTQKVIGDLVKDPRVQQIPGGDLHLETLTTNPGVTIVPAGGAVSQGGRCKG